MFASNVLTHWPFTGAAVSPLMTAPPSVLLLEDDPAIARTVALFAALAGVTTATRRIDWYALFDSAPDRSQALSFEHG